jgi:hypothetical protein
VEVLPPTEELPIQSLTGDATAPPSPERRYRALAGAVRRHRTTSSHRAVPKRPVDHALYALLSKLEADPPTPRDP